MEGGVEAAGRAKNLSVSLSVSRPHQRCKTLLPSPSLQPLVNALSLPPLLSSPKHSEANKWRGEGEKDLQGGEDEGVVVPTKIGPLLSLKLAPKTQKGTIEERGGKLMGRWGGRGPPAPRASNALIVARFF